MTCFGVGFPSAASIGVHHYMVWVKDGDGNQSNVLSFSFTVS